MPIICLFGMITNILNIIIFLNSQMKDSSFKYMLAISISDLFYLSILSYQFIGYCDECSFNRNYLLQIYTFVFDQYLSRCLAIFNILAEIFLSIQRYTVLINRQYLRQTTHKWLIISLFVISLLFYMPLLFFKQIIEIKNSLNFTSDVSGSSLQYNQLGESYIGEIIPIILTSIRIFLGTFILTAINILNATELRRRFNHSISTETNSSKLFLNLSNFFYLIFIQQKKRYYT